MNMVVMDVINDGDDGDVCAYISWVCGDGRVTSGVVRELWTMFTTSFTCIDGDEH